MEPTEAPAPRAPKIPVAVLGATGSVGQRFVSLLARHPWFELAALTGSERSAGRPYGEAVRWMQEEPLPAAAADLTVVATEPGLPARLVFSALGGDIAGPRESELAAAGHLVVSNASSHRMDPDVPLVVPEVNPDHLGLVDHPGRQDGRGAILTNPNCSTIGLVMALKPLADAFGVERVSVVTLQAASGAGIPGVPSMALLDNVIPFIPGEEEKIEAETRKILGRLERGDPRRIEPAALTVSAQANRVPVLDGHTLCVSVGLTRRPERSGELNVEAVADAFDRFTGEPQRRRLPSAPERPLCVTARREGPQPRLDRGRGRGMAVTVGRIRPCPLLDVRFVAMVHNTVRGAAGGALLLAELAADRGLLGDPTDLPTVGEGTAPAKAPAGFGP